MTSHQLYSWGRESGLLARKRFYQVALLGSAIFTAGIGFKARTTFDDFDTVAYGPVEDQHISAYAEVVRHSEPFEKLSTSRQSMDAAREAAKEWVSGMESGKLRPLNPVRYEDSFDTVAAKDEILRASNAVIGDMNRLVGRETEEGSYRKAADDALLAFKVASVIKYSDLSTVGMMGLHQRKSLMDLAKVVPHLSPEERRQIGEEVVRVCSKREPLDKMVSRERNLYVDYFSRRGYNVLQAEQDFRKVRFYDAGIQKDPMRVVDALNLASFRNVDDDFGSLVSTIIFAYRSENDSQKAAHEVVELAGSRTL